MTTKSDTNVGDLVKMIERGKLRLSEISMADKKKMQLNSASARWRLIKNHSIAV